MFQWHRWDSIRAKADAFYKQFRKRNDWHDGYKVGWYEGYTSAEKRFGTKHKLRELLGSEEQFIIGE